MSELAWLGVVPLLLSTVDGVSLAHKWKYAEQGTIEDIPRQQFIAKSGASLQVSVRLHPFLGVVPQVAIDRLLQAADLGQAMSLQLPDGRLLGWFVLESMTENWLKTLPTGELVDASLKLSLSPERAPEAEASAPLAISGAELGDETTPILIDIDRDPSTVALSEIVRGA